VLVPYINMQNRREQEKWEADARGKKKKNLIAAGQAHRLFKCHVESKEGQAPTVALT